MTLNNLSDLSVEIPQETEDQAMQNIGGLKALFPFLVDLILQQRKRMAKLSRRRQELIDKTIIHAEQNPQIIPQYTNLDEFKTKVNAINSLKRIHSSLGPFFEMLGDTIMVLQAGAYEISRAIYNSVKEAAKHGVPGAEQVYEDLSYHFRYRKKPQNTNTTTNTTNTEKENAGNTEAETEQPA